MERQKILDLNACRICMDSKDENVISLVEENGWLKLFQYCFGLELSSQDQPRVLCNECADKVKKYVKFKKQCHNSNQMWKSYNFETIDKPGDNKCKDEEQSMNSTVDDTDGYILNNIQLTNNTSDCINKYDELLDSPTNANDANSDIIKSHSIDTEKCALGDLLTNIKVALQSKIEHTCKQTQPIIKCSNEIKLTDLNTLTYICKNCQKIYTSSTQYRAHLKLCNPKKEHKKIQNSLNQKAAYNSETRLKSKTPATVNKYKQTICNKNKDQEVVHFCAICRYSSNYNEDWIKHLSKHWAQNDLQCMVCDFVGKDQAAIAAHRYTHYLTKVSKFICHICQHVARSQLNLQFHYRKAHLNKAGGLCSQPQCDKVFTAWRLWKRHEALHKHPGFICDICGQKCRHKHAIIEHMIIHTKPPSYVCDVCGKTFLRLRNMKDHMAYVHAKPNPIKCPHCSRLYKTEYHLHKHLKIEAMDKRWKCELCPREFPLMKLLNSHMKGHSDEKPHSCHICGLRYKRKRQLVIHMRNHTGYRPYKCLNCTKEFTTGNQLKVHSIIHTKILPYKCLHCEKAFRCKKRMLKHCAFSHNSADKPG